MLRLLILLSAVLAAPAASPRLEAARLAAAHERLEAQGLDRLSKTKEARAEAAWRLSRAEAWDRALGKAASAATPHDADAVVTAAGRGARHVRDGRGGPLPPGRILREGDRVLGGAEVRFHDGTALTFSPDAVATFLQVPRSDPPRALISLEKGSLRYESPAMPRGETRVHAGRSEFILKEGSCDIVAHADGAAVRPIEGRVEASGRGSRTAPGWWEAAYGK